LLDEVTSGAWPERRSTDKFCANLPFYVGPDRVIALAFEPLARDAFNRSSSLFAEQNTIWRGFCTVTLPVYR
jgi:hypothetical protein